NRKSRTLNLKIMKKYIVLIFSFITLNSFAQFTTVDIFNIPGNLRYSENGYYYKDVTGYFDQFIGTWQHQNGSTTFILKFEKRTFTESRPHVNTTFKYDDLIGVLKVIKNGVTVYDDLPTLNQNYSEAFDYNINSIDRVENFDDCYMCTYPRQRLYLKYDEPNNDNYAYLDLGMMIHTYVNNGVTKLQLNCRSDQVNPDAFLKLPDLDQPPTKTSLFLDFGTFDFVKVP